MAFQDDLIAQFQAQDAADRASALDPKNRLKMKYESIDPTTGLLKSQYQVPGAEGYTQALLAKQGQEEATGKDAAARASQQGLAQARSGLGMRGGLQSGTAANLAREQMKNQFLGQQDVAGKGMAARLGIEAQGQQLGRQAQDTNIQRSLSQVGQENQFDLDQYNQQRNVAASNRMAAATIGANQNQGSWVCTEVHNQKMLNGEDITALVRLRRYAARNHRGLASMYLRDFSPLVEKMVEGNDNWMECRYFVKKAAHLVKENKMSEAFALYFKFIKERVEKFWPECDHPEFIKLKGVA